MGLLLLLLFPGETNGSESISLNCCGQHRKMSSPAHNRSSNATKGRHSSESSGLARGTSTSSSTTGISSISGTGTGSSYDSRNFMMSSVAPASSADTSTTSDGHFTSIGMQPQMIPTISGAVSHVCCSVHCSFASDRLRGGKLTYCVVWIKREVCNILAVLSSHDTSQSSTTS